MTPVAPDRFKIQQDKLMLLPSLRKRGIRPRLPLELRRLRVCLPTIAEYEQQWGKQTYEKLQR